MSTTSQRAGNIIITLIAGSCGLLALTYPAWRAEAQADCRVDSPCLLFPERPAFVTGELGTITEARSFASVSRSVTINIEREMAFLSSKPVFAPFAVDNFIAINSSCQRAVTDFGTTICSGVSGTPNCFAELRRPDLAEDVVAGRTNRDIFINEILTEIPPVELTFLRSGDVDFRLCDFGVIAGNTDLYLIISPRPVTPVEPPETREQCIRRVRMASNDEFFRRCAQPFNACIETRSEPDECEELRSETAGTILQSVCMCTIQRNDCQDEINEELEEALLGCPAR